jgi:hypothetical protein
MSMSIRAQRMERPAPPGAAVSAAGGPDLAPRHPPPRVWLLALGWCALAAWVLLCSPWKPVPPRLKPTAHELHVQRLAAARGDGLSVVALGTSKTMRAVPWDDEFMRRYAQALPGLRFHRITWSGVDLLSLEPALAALAAMHPDVVLVEADMLLFDRAWVFDTQAAAAGPWQALRLAMRHTLHRWLGVAPTLPQWENYGDDPPGSPQDYCAETHTPQGMERYRETQAHSIVAGAARRQAYLDRLKPLAEAGSRIVLLELPRAPAADALQPPGRDAVLQQTLQALQRETGFAYWAPPRLADALYCDQGHMLPAGRERYSAWLAGQLAGLTQARP